ncbi:MAG: hypothetical protein NTZ56_06290 [Acidobacteria bacterium]|nr:hypothetical protein [Acidobacteriota bacterium]
MGFATDYRFVWLGGFTAGTLDILFAIGYWAVKAHVPAQRILQSVAAGLLGKASFSGGWGTALLGLALHFFIATCMAFAYCLVAQRWGGLQKYPLPYGAVYGLALYLVMNYVVIPLSAAGSSSSPDLLWISLGVLVHMLFIGVPIALAVNRALAPASH